jgi:5-methylcytosine-specific restriction enzyme subunit McrC
MDEVFLLEGGPPVTARLAEDLVSQLVEARIVTAYPVGPGRWELTAASQVGVVRAGEVTIWIRPKLPIARLVFLLGYARRPGWRQQETVSFATVPDLLPALARAFADQAERALRPGLLQGYEVVDDALPVLRGRLREHDQLRERFGLAVPLLVRYDDYQSDIAENRILRGATDRLLRLPGVDGRTLVRLRALRQSLFDVTSPPTGRPLPAWYPTRLNARYHDVLWLAELILSGNSIDQAPGHLRLSGFLVNMAKVFEDFVTATLSAALAAHEGTCRPQDRLYLDDGEQIAMRPDLVWYRGGTPIGVIDAKYKAEKPSGFPDADFYQLLAYATALGLHHAHLVYAKGNESPRRFTVRNTAITIHAHTLDLDTQPGALLDLVMAVANRVIDAAIAASSGDPAPAPPRP